MSDNASIRNWVELKLQIMLGFDGVEEIADYILSMYETASQGEIMDYLEQFLGKTPEVEVFMHELMSFKTEKGLNKLLNSATTRDVVQQQSNNDDFWGNETDNSTKFGKMHVKDDQVFEYMSGTTSKKPQQQQQQQPRQQQQKTQYKQQQHNLQQKTSKKDKKKNQQKHSDQSKVKWPESTGIKCQCMATEHALLGNCTNCGKIICELEGWGTCSFCGAILNFQPHLTNGDSSSSSQNTKSKMNNPYQQHSDITNKEALANVQATELKDKLLLYQKESTQRTKIFDDQADYFNSMGWLTNEEREQMEAKEEERREHMHKKRSEREITITFDIAGRRVTETSSNDDINIRESGNNNVKTASKTPISFDLDGNNQRLSFPSMNRVYENETLNGKAKDVYEAFSKHFATARKNAEARQKAKDEESSFLKVQHEEEDGKFVLSKR